jgi:hypothetical protein
VIKKTASDVSNTSKKKVVKKAASKKKVATKKVVASKSQAATQTAAEAPAEVAKKAPVTGKDPVVKKAPASKKKVAARSAKAAKQTVVSPRERYEMVATMAYYRAEARNFAPGYAEQDWFECEQIIDEMLNKSESK